MGSSPIVAAFFNPQCRKHKKVLHNLCGGQVKPSNVMFQLVRNEGLLIGVNLYEGCGKAIPPFAVQKDGRWYADFSGCQITKMVIHPQYEESFTIKNPMEQGFFPNSSSNGEFFLKFTTPCGQEWKAAGGCSPSSYYEIWQGVHPNM